MSALSDWQLLESPERRALRESVRSLAESAWGRERQLDASDVAHRRALWDGLRAVGAVGLTVPLADGGSGGDHADAAALACEVGHGLLPLSTAEALVVGPQAAAVPDLVDGSLRAALHLDIGGALRLHATGTGRRLEGRIGRVAGLADADILVVVTAFPDSTDRYAVLALRTARVRPSMRPAPGDDYYGDASVALDLDVLSDEMVGALSRREAHRLAGLTAVLHCFEIAGGLDGLVAQTAGHLRRRQQFGRPLIQFQALQHRMADLGLAHHLAETAALDGLHRLLHDDGEPTADARATVRHLTRSYQSSVEIAVQLHGAIGFTWEAGIHRYLGHAVRAGALAAAGEPTSGQVIDARRP